MQMRASTLLLLALSLPAWGVGFKPKVTNVTSLVMRHGLDGSLGMQLEGGEFVPLKEATGEDTQVLFEDLMPGANWGHPAHLRVMRKGRELLRRLLHLPPRGLGAAQKTAPPVKVAIKATDPKTTQITQEAEEPEVNYDVTFAMSDLGGKLRVADPSKFHAILINGSPNERHWNDFAFLYRTLTQVYGYLPENIYVADSTSKETKGDLDGSSKNRIAYSSTLDGIKEMFAKIKERIKKDDQVILAVNDHGSIQDNESTIVLFDGEMKASVFNELVKSLPSKKMVAIFEQCFGGGFVRPLAEFQTIAMAASTNREYSWSTPDMKFNEFFYHLITAFAQQTHDGKRVYSDGNHDGKVSVQEAFSYAVKHDRQSESPVLEAPPNSGLASQMGLTF